MNYKITCYENWDRCTFDSYSLKIYNPGTFKNRIFDTLDEAIAEAKIIINDFFLSSLFGIDKDNIEKLSLTWIIYGDTPMIDPMNEHLPPSGFDGREYARELQNRILNDLNDNRDNIQQVYNDTLKYAAEKHAENNQTIPGTIIPYAVHLSNVCMEIIFAAQQTENFNLKLALQIALLHDLLEDTKTTMFELDERFGFLVQAGVKALTKNEKLPEEEQMPDSLRRIKKMPVEVWAVKLADRITNLQQPPPAHWSLDKVTEYRRESAVIYHELREGNDYLAERLRDAKDRYGRLIPEDVLQTIIENHELSEERFNEIFAYNFLPEQYNRLAAALCEMKKYEWARIIYDEAIVWYPSFEDSYANYMAFSILLEQYDRCEHIYQQGMRDSSGRKSSIVYQDGRLHFIKGNYSMALSAARSVLNVEKFQHEGAFVLAINSMLALAEQGEDVEKNDQEAKKLLRFGLSVFNDSEQLIELSKKL